MSCGPERPTRLGFADPPSPHGEGGTEREGMESSFTLPPREGRVPSETRRVGRPGSDLIVLAYAE